MLKVGHRGASGIAPENTKAAFLKSIELGLDMVELDIQLTKDNNLIVFHDYDLKRIAGLDEKIGNMTLIELKEIDIGSWFSDEFSDERILTLKEVINLLKDKMKINIEIKINQQKSEIIMAKLLDILKEEEYEEGVIISSFDHRILKLIKRKNYSLRTAVLIGALPVNPIRLIQEAEADGIHPHYLTVNRALVEEVKDYGYFINTWTVNSKEEVDRLVKLGVDGIMSDYPELF
jgi:glycerophosphoryl diester phosphodiesterase